MSRTDRNVAQKMHAYNLIELDDYCVKILLVLLTEQQAYYNELYRLIKKKLNLKKFSKPTFNTHACMHG